MQRKKYIHWMDSAVDDPQVSYLTDSQKHCKVSYKEGKNSYFQFSGLKFFSWHLKPSGFEIAVIWFF